MSELDRSNLTFRQAEGFEPLPTPLSLGSITKESRALIWAAVYNSLAEDSYADRTTAYERRINDTWHLTLRAWHVKRLHKPIDEYSANFDANIDFVKQIVFNWKYDYLFDFLTFVMREGYVSDSFDRALAKSFADARLAYSVRDATIYPSVSPEEGDAVNRSFNALVPEEFTAARAHLREAGRLLSGGKYPDAVRESIHSVESVAKVIEPSASTLSDALKVLMNKRGMNPNLKRGLEALYNYTSDEEGIRHARVFESGAVVDEIDAVFMFGACAAFITFLINRHRS